MTDKDPKDMSAAELLRWAANGEPYNGIDENIWTCPTGKIKALAEAVTGKWPSDNEIFSIVADKIDAELAEARGEALRQGAELWAKANGWPDFKDGENFGGWLERCAIPRPRFEDGEPVQFGDEKFIFLRNGGCCQMQDADGNICNVFHGKRVKRRAPEVLGADGLPLDEDDTVYVMGREQHRYTVQVPYSINEEVGKRFCVQCYDHDEGNITWCDPSMLTHERPVLGADGKPIKVGDAMWSLSGAGPLTVTSLHTDDPTPDGGDSPWADLDDDGLYSWIYAGSLTHTPPDTLERLRDDMYRTAEEWREADSVSVTDMNHWANRLAALIERKGGE